MGVFHVFKIVEMVPNRAKHLIWLILGVFVVVFLVKKLLKSVQANARLFLNASRYSIGKHLKNVEHWLAMRQVFKKVYLNRGYLIGSYTVTENVLKLTIITQEHWTNLPLRICFFVLERLFG